MYLRLSIPVGPQPGSAFFKRKEAGRGNGLGSVSKRNGLEEAHVGTIQHDNSSAGLSVEWRLQGTIGGVEAEVIEDVLEGLRRDVAALQTSVKEKEELLRSLTEQRTARSPEKVYRPRKTRGGSGSDDRERSTAEPTTGRPTAGSGIL